MSIRSSILVACFLAAMGLQIHAKRVSEAQRITATADVVRDAERIIATADIVAEPPGACCLYGRAKQFRWVTGKADGSARHFNQDFCYRAKWPQILAGVKTSFTKAECNKFEAGNVRCCCQEKTQSECKYTFVGPNLCCKRRARENINARACPLWSKYTEHDFKVCGLQ